jgi:hypothetical protein
MGWYGGGGGSLSQSEQRQTGKRYAQEGGRERDGTTRKTHLESDAFRFEDLCVRNETNEWG